MGFRHEQRTDYSLCLRTGLGFGAAPAGRLPVLAHRARIQCACRGAQLSVTTPRMSHVAG